MVSFIDDTSFHSLVAYFNHFTHLSHNASISNEA